MMTGGLRFGQIGSRAVHVAIDMQIFFAENSEWAAQATLDIEPEVATIAAHCPHRTIFTRFLTPHSADVAKGQWRPYYKRWKSVLAKNNDPAIFDLLPTLKPYAPPALVVDKYTYSAFETAGFAMALETLKADTLIFTGVESDVCVLGTALTAIDRGFRVILINDALASSSPRGHDAVMQHVFTRFDQQVEIIDTKNILEEWKQ